MAAINWNRVVVLGVIAGMLWSGISLVLLVLVGSGIFESGRLPRLQGAVMAFGMALNIVTGIWTMWLTAAIRPRYGAGTMSAVVAGVAWWVIAAALNLHWANLLVVPYPAAIALVASWLPGMVATTVLCARPYRDSTEEIRSTAAAAQ